MKKKNKFFVSPIYPPKDINIFHGYLKSKHCVKKEPPRKPNYF